MKIRPRLLVATTGVAAALVGVPAIALAAPSSSPTSSPTSSAPASSSAACPRQELHQAVASYLAAHPDLAAERKTLQSLPADQRAAARKKYFADHADERTDLAKLGKDAHTGLADRLAAASDALAAHPDLAPLESQLRSASAGQRAQVVRTYLQEHQGSRAEVRSVLAALRGRSSTCRTSG